MKQESMKVLFFIRKSKLLKNGEAPIFLRVTVNGQLDEIRIQRSIPVKMWNNAKGCSRGKDRASIELNSYIESLTVRLYQIHKELLCQEALITPKNLLAKLFSKEERRTVLGTMKKYMDDWTALIGKEYQKSTLSRYGNCYESLATVINEFYKKEDIAFSELNGEFIDAFEMHLNAHMMDVCRTSKEQYYYSDEAEEKDLTPNPYPWNTAKISCFDPTLDMEQKYEPEAGLTGIEIQPIKGKEEEDWINKNEYLPDFRCMAKFHDGSEYVMLMGYDTSKEDEKETFLFSNAGFVKQEDAGKFADWAKIQNFYGRWMPEHRGMTEFLWNDYPWADVYKSSVEHEVWSRLHDCSCDMQLSYEAQLQEDWEGIDREKEFLSTVYMPCAEMMEQMGLYCSEIRGVINATDGSVAALNTGHGNCVNGLFVRRDILNDYLKQNDYVMFYYVLGEKVLRIGEMNSVIKDLSASYQYQSENEIVVIQPMRVIERNSFKGSMVNPELRVALKKKYDDERLTSFLESLKGIPENDDDDN